MTSNTRDETRTLSGWIDQEVRGNEGEKIGKIDAVYVDESTGQPEWLGVATGLFGRHVSLVPLAPATTDAKGDAVFVPFSKDKVKDAPRVDPDETLSEQEEAQLYHHYGLGYSEDRSETGFAEGPKRDAMTRSEEELRVDRTAREAGRVRLRKWVETEETRTKVPVNREEARIEREPITEANIDRATRGPEISEAEHEVVLREEQPVASKQTVPKERVRLEKDTVTEEAEVSADLRKERVGVEGDSRDGRRSK